MIVTTDNLLPRLFVFDISSLCPGRSAGRPNPTLLETVFRKRLGYGQLWRFSLVHEFPETTGKRGVILVTPTEEYEGHPAGFSLQFTPNAAFAAIAPFENLPRPASTVSRPSSANGFPQLLNLQSSTIFRESICLLDRTVVGYRIMRSELVREASVRATGADIHEVQNLISAYGEACAIASDPESHGDLLWDVFDGRRKALLKWARNYERACERSLQAYVSGVPVKRASGCCWYESRKIRSLRALGKIGARRLFRL